MDIDFSIPTRIIMEGDVLANRMPYVKGYGDRVLIVTSDDRFQDSRLGEEVTVLLEDYDIKTVFYKQSKGIPTVAELEAGAALAREAQVDFVMAIGGATILDTGKAIALLAAADIGAQTLVASPGQRSLPLVCLPTNAGTGTEVTASIYVTHRHEDGDQLIQVVNPALAPSLALLDASYTLDTPNDESLAHLLKIIARSVDALISEDANPMTDSLVLSALGMIVDYPPKVLGEETLTLWEREDCMLAAVQVGMALQHGKGIISSLGTALSLVRPIRLGEAYGLALHALLPALDQQAPFASDILCNAFDKDDMADLSADLQSLLPSFAPLSSAEHDQVLRQILAQGQDTGSVLRFKEDDLSQILSGIGIEGMDEEVSE